MLRRRFLAALAPVLALFIAPRSVKADDSHGPIRFDPKRMRTFQRQGQLWLEVLPNEVRAGEPILMVGMDSKELWRLKLAWLTAVMVAQAYIAGDVRPPSIFSPVVPASTEVTKAASEVRALERSLAAVTGHESPQRERGATMAVPPEERGPDRREERA